MKNIKKVLICGLGAIGSIYAQKISRCNDIDLRILVDEKRLQIYQNSPLMFNGHKLELNYILPSESEYKADLIIIAVKFNGLMDACKNIKNFVKSGTIILSLLNGVISEEFLAEEYGNEKLLLSYFIGHSAVRDGRNISFDGIGKVVFGISEKFGTECSLQILKEFFEKIGADYEIPDEMTYALWLKFMLNVAVNPLTALLRIKFKDLLNNPQAMDLAVKVMQEVESLAEAEGVKNTENMIEQTLKNLQTMAPEGKTSMLQDVEAGRMTENEMLSGTIVKLGEKYAISTPVNRVFYNLINAIESKAN